MHELDDAPNHSGGSLDDEFMKAPKFDAHRQYQNQHLCAGGQQERDHLPDMLA